MEKINCHKLAVFDLDGTLYRENSHIEYITKVYKTVIFKTLFWKVFACLLPQVSLKIMYWLYDRKKEYANDFILPFRDKTIEILNKYKLNKWHVIIVSNAPSELLISPSNKLDIQALRAPINKKLNVLKSKYEYDVLFVCTDNITDIDLINEADSAVVFFKSSNLKKFKDRIKNTDVDYYDIEEL